MTSRTETLRQVKTIVDAGLAPPERRAALERVAARYAVAITPAMQELIDAGDPGDPIARQFVPDPSELNAADSELADPIGDAAHSPVAGIVHRYPDRVLLTPVHLCAVYCRFCFRRETVGPGAAAVLSDAELAAAVDYIARHPQIWEVILSGGDPLILSRRRLRAVLDALAAIGHVKVVRFHTRVPAVAPERVTPALARALRVAGKASYVVLHANHPRELTEAARAACGRIVDAGVPMLSQSVLLRGVNDDPVVLAELMRAFVEARVKPYYLHHLDPAPGTGQFRTSIARGQELVHALRGHHSGLCQPTYVLDLPGGHGKAPVGRSAIVAEEDGQYEIEDYRGNRHPYRTSCG